MRAPDGLVEDQDDDDDNNDDDNGNDSEGDDDGQRAGGRAGSAAGAESKVSGVRGHGSSGHRHGGQDLAVSRTLTASLLRLEELYIKLWLLLRLVVKDAYSRHVDVLDAGKDIQVCTAPPSSLRPSQKGGGDGGADNEIFSFPYAHTFSLSPASHSKIPLPSGWEYVCKISSYFMCVHSYVPYLFLLCATGMTGDIVCCPSPSQSQLDQLMKTGNNNSTRSEGEGKSGDNSPSSSPASRLQLPEEFQALVGGVVLRAPERLQVHMDCVNALGEIVAIEDVDDMGGSVRLVHLPPPPSFLLLVYKNMNHLL